jgi:hypothetical protein
VVTTVMALASASAMAAAVALAAALMAAAVAAALAVLAVLAAVVAAAPVQMDSLVKALTTYGSEKLSEEQARELVSQVTAAACDKQRCKLGFGVGNLVCRVIVVCRCYTL